MGIFNIFKKPLKIQDDFFGELSLTSFKDSRKNFFTGQKYFNELNPKVEVINDSDNTGTTASQRSRYQEIQDNFSRLIEKMTPLIVDAFQNWIENFKISDFNKEFRIESITMARIDSKPFNWDICFTTLHDKNHWVIIDFVDFEPQRVLIDG